jgi:Uma2 family endonuclease
MKTATFDTIDELLENLGGISPKRVLLKPWPGTATIKDVIRHVDGPKKRLVELVDGTLVEKPMGYAESMVATELSRLIGNHLVEIGRPGVLTGEAGTIRVLEKFVRIPDIAYVSWDRLPNRRVPVAKVPEVVPNLCVEVLSESNTPAEMGRKLKEYFVAGVDLVWFVDPDTRTLKVFTSPDESKTLTAKDTLTGGAVLPGFAVPVAELFAGLPAVKKATPKPKKKRK